MYLRAFFIVLAVLFAVPALAATDSIGIQEKDGEKFIVHQLQRGQDINYLTRRYNVSTNAIQDANPGVDEVRAYDYILIPWSGEVAKKTANSGSKPKTESSAPATEGNRKVHEVQQGETMFSISRKYDATVEDIKRWNNLDDHNISVGSKLYVEPPEGDGRAPTEDAKQDESGKSETAKARSKEDEPEDSVRKSEQQKRAEKSNEHGYREIREEGKASWIDDGEFDGNMSLAMHPSAPVGTIIEVKNLMNNRIAYVRVVGRLPDSPENSDLVIKISKAAAEKLDVRDPSFRAELKYAGKENS